MLNYGIQRTQKDVFMYVYKANGPSYEAECTACTWGLNLAIYGADAYHAAYINLRACFCRVQCGTACPMLSKTRAALDFVLQFLVIAY